MAGSRYVSARRLKALVSYFAFAFLTVLAVDVLLPAGQGRTVMSILWIIGFPLGAWWVFRRTAE